MRQTRTYAVLTVSRPAFEEIYQLLRAAGYAHAFEYHKHQDEQPYLIDMNGIAISTEEA